MTTPTHFHDFKPCEAVQYDGDRSNAREIATSVLALINGEE